MLLRSVVGANTLGNKKEFGRAQYDGPSENAEQATVGVEEVGAEGGGPVYMTGRVKIVSLKR